MKDIIELLKAVPNKNGKFEIHLGIGICNDDSFNASLLCGDATENCVVETVQKYCKDALVELMGQLGTRLTDIDIIVCEKCLSSANEKYLDLIRLTDAQIEKIKELFLSYPYFATNPFVGNIDYIIEQSVILMSDTDKSRILEIINQCKLQSGDERDELYGIILLSLSDDDKLILEKDYFENEKIVVP